MNATAATMLAGPEAGEILAAALATTGIRLERWRLDALHPRPGAETSAGYEVGTADGQLYVVASTVALSEAARAACGAVRLDSDVGTVHVWLHPADPELTDLATACRRDLLGERLTEAMGEPVSVARLELLVLRPLRRAVVRVDAARASGEVTFYVKVVRPARAAGLLKRHSMCALAPSARSAGGGLVVVEAAEGVSLASALYRPQGGPPGCLAPDVLEAALEGLPSAAMELQRRPSVPDRCEHYAGVVAERMRGDEAVARLLARVVDGLASAPPDAECPTHGDLNPANIFVDSARSPSRVSALIDIDTLGPGRRADDHASLLAHLLVLPTFDQHAYAGAPAYANELYARFALHDDERDLRCRVAANLVALAATATSRDLRSWVRLAEHVMDRSILR